VINSVVLIGRLTRDPELRTTPSGKNVCHFGIAVQKRVKPADGSPDADFFNISCWERTAEYVSNYLHKGRLVGVQGRLQSRKYVASDGSNREVYEIVADNIQSLERPRDDSGAGGGEALAATGARPTATAAAAPGADEYDPFADE